MTLPGVGELSGKRWSGDLTEGFGPDNMNLLAPQGFVSQNPLVALEVDVWPKRWNNADTLETYPGVEGVAVTASQTNYIYLDGDEDPADQLQVSTSGFPSASTGQFFYLAEVVCNSSAITSITQVLTHSAVGAQANVQSVGVQSPILNTGSSTNPVIDINDAAPGTSGAMPGDDEDEGIWRQSSSSNNILPPGSDGEILKMISGALTWTAAPDLKCILVARAAASVAAGNDITLTEIFTLGDSSEIDLDPDGDNAAEVEIVNASRKVLAMATLAGGGTQAAIELQKEGLVAETFNVLADTNAHSTAISAVSPSAGDYLKYRVTSNDIGSSTSQFVVLLVFGS